MLDHVPLEYIMQQLRLLAPHYWNKPETANCTLLVPLSNVDAAPCVSLPLHAEYLSAKSVLLRGLLSGLSPPPRPPRSRLPRLLPSPPSHPVVFLPVPDPSSIQLIIYWIYFGSTDHIENALDRGDVLWEDLARNAEYLGLSIDFKVFLGRWYRDWFLPARSCPTDDEEEDESDLDSDCDDDDLSSTPPADDEDCRRGRTRDVKPLVQLCGQLCLCT